MSGLAEFLLARIGEDEAAARTVGVIAADEWLGVLEYGEGDTLSNEQVAHLARWSPARVLAECEAKRRISELHDDGHECSQYVSNGEVNSYAYSPSFEDCSTLQLLALPYADHPDYHDEWRP